MNEQRFQWLFWTVPGVAALALSVLGQWSSGAAHLALFASIPLVLWNVLLLVLGGVRWARGGQVLPLLAGLLLSALACWTSADVVHGVPQWVKTAATPALVSLDRWRVEHGQYPRVDSGDPGFPSQLRDVLGKAGCPHYLPRNESFELTCEGVLFTLCSYNAATQTWSSWD